VGRNLVARGICETLIPIIKIYAFDTDKIDDATTIIDFIVNDPENVPRFLSAGLLEALVRVFNLQDVDVIHSSLTSIIRQLCKYDSSIVQHFHNLGIPEGSSLFGGQLP
jgi:methenyltetrahydromethanopterin cyclohydrolase